MQVTSNGLSEFSLTLKKSLVFPLGLLGVCMSHVCTPMHVLHPQCMCLGHRTAFSTQTREKHAKRVSPGPGSAHASSKPSPDVLGGTSGPWAYLQREHATL
jgi:hypothetical protein